MYYTIEIEAIKESYKTFDQSLSDLLEIFPEAFLNGDWQETATETFMYIYNSCTDNTVIGKIFEQE
jgi:hypothetical protein